MSAEARRLAAFACRRGAGARTSPAALAWLSLHRARHGRRRPCEEELARPTRPRQRVGGYAAAVFEDMSTDALEEIEDELFRFARTVEAHARLRAALGDRDLPVAVRQGWSYRCSRARCPATAGAGRYA